MRGRGYKSHMIGRPYKQPSSSNPRNAAMQRRSREELISEIAEVQATRDNEMREVQTTRNAESEWYFAFVKRMLIQDMKKGDGFQDIPWVPTKDESEVLVTDPGDYLKIFEEDKTSVQNLYDQGGCTEDEMFMEICRLSENYVQASADFVGSLGWFWMQFCTLYKRGQGYQHTNQCLTASALRLVCNEWGISVQVAEDAPYMIAHVGYFF